MYRARSFLQRSAVLAPRSCCCLLVLFATASCSSSVDWEREQAPALVGIGARSGADVRLGETNKVSIVTFGYASCVDLCPLTLGDLDSVFSRLGNNADDVRALYVTVDPRRDSIDALRALLAPHDRRIEGVRIDEDALPDVLDRWDITVEKHGADPRRFVDGTFYADDYSMNHTSTYFVIDAGNRLRARVEHRAGPAVLYDVVAKVLDEQSRVRVRDAFARVSPSGGGAAYFDIEHRGARDRLLRVSSQEARRVEMHETVHDGDIARMRSVQEIDVDGDVFFRPGGRHLMLFGVKDGIDEIPLQLTFERAGEVLVHAKVTR